jgi:hypothetical protein
VGVGLAARLHLVQRVGMRGAVPPLPASSCRVIQLSTGYFFMLRCLLKHRDRFSFTFYGIYLNLLKFIREYCIL